jgi:SOS-response transcriptional repressor LexA
MLRVHVSTHSGKITASSTVNLPRARFFQCGNFTAMIRDIVQRIEERLQAVGLSAAAASKRAGTPDAIRNMQRAARDGGRQGISTATLMKLAPVLKTSAEWLLEGKGTPDAVSVAVAQVPVISWVKAGALAMPDIVTDGDDAPLLPMAGLPPGDWFALTVVGDSMDRISPPESVILVNRRERSLVPNACYVFADEDGAATYKRFRPSPRRLEPVSTNLDHQPIFIDEPRIVGRVRYTLLKL